MKLSIYKASAGSGKTHILAGKYIVESFGRVAPARSNSSLYEAFKDTMAFARIIAVTFTNKAAGEMKERILKELDKLASGQGSDYVDDILNKYPQYTPEQVAQRAKYIRSAVLHNYSDFNLRTIDSFVQRIVRAFCYDININSGFSTQTDEKMVLGELIDLLLKKSDDDSDLREQFLDMASKNVKEGVNWDFRSQLISLASLIFTEQFQELEKFQEKLDENSKREYLQTSLLLVKTIVEDYEEKAKSISDAATKIFDQLPYTPSEIGKNIGILSNFFKNSIEECEIKTTIQKLLNDEGWTNKKPTQIQVEYIPSIKPKLMPLLENATALINQHGTDYLTAKVILSDFHAFMLLGDLARLMPEYRQENRMMLVSDATTFLNAIVEGNDAPFIYERIGNKFDHVFIDEFQDTSEYQWNNFRPLIENTLAQGFNDMIVGDVKQSIYRFRGGDWSLLNSKVCNQLGEDAIDMHSLDTNWRSRKNIVDFNNAIFHNSVDILQKNDDNGLDFDLLRNIYSDSFQKLPSNRDRKGGKVNVVFFDDEELDESMIVPDEDADKFEIKALNRMAYEINSLIANGIKAKKICILVRKGKEANLVVNFLMKYQQMIENAAHYDVVSSDSLYIRNSLAVTVVSNAMKYINNTSDIIAKVEMMRAYCMITNNEYSDDTIFKAVANTDTNIIPKGFDNIMETYSGLPLYDLCEKIISCFSLQQFEGDAEYLRTFEDCVLSFTKNYSSDLNRFVRWWDESGIKTAIQPSDEQNAVTVMTVHKSKGLDFSIQFVPFCDWKMEDYNNQQAKYIWVKAPSNTIFKSMPLLPVRYSKKLANTHFAEPYYEEKRNLYVDSLNLLYVAFTRAVDELHVYCPTKNNDKISTVADLLYYNITAETQQPNNIIHLADFYDEATGELIIDTEHTYNTGFKLKEYKGFKVSGFSNTPWDNRLSVLSHSADFFIQNSPFLQERINHGLFMHEVMSQIEYKEDAPQVLQDMKHQGRITEQQRLELQKLLDKAFATPQVEEWFSHQWKQVITERALLTTEGNIRIPDRVLVSDTETIVIDFKFGKERPEYHAQILEYAQLLSSMKNPSYPPVQAYLYYVETGKIEHVQQNKKIN